MARPHHQHQRQKTGGVTGRVSTTYNKRRERKKYIQQQRSTFNNTRGVSNIDLTIVNNNLLTDVHDWEISEEDSLSDHSYLKYKISTSRGKPYKNKTKYRSAKYVIKEEKLVILQALSTRNDKKDQHDKQRSRSR